MKPFKPITTPTIKHLQLHIHDYAASHGIQKNAQIVINQMFHFMVTVTKELFMQWP